MICSSDFGAAHGGRNDVMTHVNGKRHIHFANAASSSRSVATYFSPQALRSSIEAETRWAMFVAKHNLAFVASDHANKLFTTMFPN